MKNIAIVGEMASGKTTIADILVRYHGYTRVSLAKRLKEVTASVYGGGEPIYKDTVYLIEEKPITGRQVLQQFGQTVKMFDRDFWLRWMLNDIRNGEYGFPPYVIDDCRFPFEADALRAEGFAVVRLWVPENVRVARYETLYGRPPTFMETSHPSETEVSHIEPDYVVMGTKSPSVIVDEVLREVAA